MTRTWLPGGRRGIDAAIRSRREGVDIRGVRRERHRRGSVRIDPVDDAAGTTARPPADPEGVARSDQRPEEGRVHLVDRLGARAEKEAAVGVDRDVVRLAGEEVGLGGDAPEDRARGGGSEARGEYGDRDEREARRRGAVCARYRPDAGAPATLPAGCRSTRHGAHRHSASAGSTVSVIRREPETTWPVGSPTRPASPRGAA